MVDVLAAALCIALYFTFISRTQFICHCGFLHLILLCLLRYSKLLRRLLYQILLLTSFRAACAICPSVVLGGARGLFASGSSLSFVVLLASGAAVYDAVADDDAGVAAGFCVCFLAILDLLAVGCLRIGK